MTGRKTLTAVLELASDLLPGARSATPLGKGLYGVASGAANLWIFSEGVREQAIALEEEDIGALVGMMMTLEQARKAGASQGRLEHRYRRMMLRAAEMRQRGVQALTEAAAHDGLIRVIGGAHLLKGPAGDRADAAAEIVGNVGGSAAPALAKADAPNVETPKPEGPKKDAPTTAGPRDARAQVVEADLPRLQAELGAKAVFDETLGSRAELRFGTAANGDVTVTELRIGPHALHADVVVHLAMAKRITRYNGLTGELRKLWDRVVALAGGTRNIFPPGSLEWEAFEELGKLDQLARLRRTGAFARQADAAVLEAELGRLAAARAKYAAVIAAAERSGKWGKGKGVIASPELRALGEGPDVDDLRVRGSPQAVGAPVPKTSRSTEALLRAEPERTAAHYPKGWQHRGDQGLLAQHAHDVDSHEARFLDALAEEWEHHRQLTRTLHEQEATLAAAGPAGRDALAARVAATREALEDSKRVQGGYKSKLTEAEGERATARWILEHEPDLELVRGFATGDGFDQVWVRRDAKGQIREYVIVEAKGHGARLSTGAGKGDQMTPKWVSKTIAEMRREGEPLGHAMQVALSGSSVPVSGRLFEADGVGGAVEHMLAQPIYK